MKWHLFSVFVLFCLVSTSECEKIGEGNRAAFTLGQLTPNGVAPNPVYLAQTHQFFDEAAGDVTGWLQDNWLVLTVSSVSVCFIIGLLVTLGTEGMDGKIKGHIQQKNYGKAALQFVKWFLYLLVMSLVLGLIVVIANGVPIILAVVMIPFMLVAMFGGALALNHLLAHIAAAYANNNTSASEPRFSAITSAVGGIHFVCLVLWLGFMFAARRAGVAQSSFQVANEKIRGLFHKDKILKSNNYASEQLYIRGIAYGVKAFVLGFRFLAMLLLKDSLSFFWSLCLLSTISSISSAVITVMSTGNWRELLSGPIFLRILIHAGIELFFDLSLNAAILYLVTNNGAKYPGWWEQIFAALFANVEGVVTLGFLSRWFVYGFKDQKFFQAENYGKGPLALVYVVTAAVVGVMVYIWMEKGKSLAYDVFVRGCDSELASVDSAEFTTCSNLKDHGINGGCFVLCQSTETSTLLSDTRMCPVVLDPANVDDCGKNWYETPKNWAGLVLFMAGSWVAAPVLARSLYCKALLKNSGLRKNLGFGLKVQDYDKNAPRVTTKEIASDITSRFQVKTEFEPQTFDPEAAWECADYLLS